MLSKSKKNNLPILILLAFFLSGCVTIYNPATQQRETLLIGTEREVSLGQDMDRELQKELEILSDLKVQQRLHSIGNRIASASDRQDISYYFRVVKDEELNAFAIPGGFVYLNSGLISAATDDELACILAHEIGHLAARHSVKKLQAALGTQVIVSLAFGLSGNATMTQALDVVFNVVSLGYSRKDEFLADKLAVKYAKKAKFNPYGMVTFFEKLKKEAQEKGSNFKLAFLSSHPPIEERIQKVKSEILTSN